ncbi:hypothetical protein [Streptomyces badius]|uniref:WD40 repeat domain-containing protein n=1 Tax=Streptomyces badius TaxID=1941 RepID=A0ABQ2TND3_STRBA|nr:hypothetical protein [Streptomyces badius]GGS80340.1 hypothetical protein GCM10010253_63950 [Streptomyces badius]
MNVEELVRDSLREQASDVPPPRSGFAGRILAARRRRRARTLAAAAGATALVVAAAVGVPRLLDGGRGQGVHVVGGEVSDRGVLSHVDQSPPRDKIAVGDQVLAAYFTSEKVRQPNRDEIVERTYSVLNQETGRYEVDERWSFLAVAPGMRTAAVLERELPAPRIGLLDLRTGKVARWIPLAQGVGGLFFSPDGSKLVATTYDKNPDRSYWSHRIPVNDRLEPRPVPSRTGFAVVDVATGESDWHALPASGGIGSGQKLRFNADGTLLYEDINMAPGIIYRDLEGRQVATPAREAHVNLVSAPAGLSPDGTLVAGPFAGHRLTTATEVLDPRTGERLAKLRGQELLAWVDNTRLIAWDIAPGAGEYDTRLVLVGIGSKNTISLSGARTPKDHSSKRWEPIFTRC